VRHAGQSIPCLLSVVISCCAKYVNNGTNRYKTRPIITSNDFNLINKCLGYYFRLLNKVSHYSNMKKATFFYLLFLYKKEFYYTMHCRILYYVLRLVCLSSACESCSVSQDVWLVPLCRQTVRVIRHFAVLLVQQSFNFNNSRRNVSKWGNSGRRRAPVIKSNRSEH